MTLRGPSEMTLSVCLSNSPATKTQKIRRLLAHARVDVT